MTLNRPENPFDIPYITPSTRAKGEVWMSPARMLQPTFFDEKQAAQDVFAYYGVSLDEIDRWHERKWLSFDSKIKHVSSLEFHELLFIRSLVHFGLTDAMITTMLSYLEKPYQYSPFDHAFCFAYGWVGAAPDLTENIFWQLIENHFETFVRHKANNGEEPTLYRMRRLIDAAIRELDVKKAREQEQE